jgi:hypothetical protein
VGVEERVDYNTPQFNKKCETCGAKLEGYTRKSQHCNGYWNQEYTLNVAAGLSSVLITCLS